MHKEGFLTLNRYKEKCFLVKPLMRSMHERGELTGAAAMLMSPLPEEELYDTEDDPHEINNLAGDPAYEAQLTEMRQALEAWIIETNDLGRIMEPDSVVAPFIEEMNAWFGTPSWAESE